MESLVALFLGAFLAATIVPFSSELGLAAVVALRDDPLVPWAVATAGNVLGSVVNWALGRFLADRAGHRWFPVSPAALERAGERFRRWGLPSLLLAWVPVIGDPLTLAAGVLRAPFAPFLVLVAVGKGARYAIIAWVSS